MWSVKSGVWSYLRSFVLFVQQVQLPPEEGGQGQEGGVQSDEDSPILIDDTYIGSKNPAAGNKESRKHAAGGKNQETGRQFPAESSITFPVLGKFGRQVRNRQRQFQNGRIFCFADLFL